MNFAYNLLTELTRTFLAYADNVRAQDSAAYAIQVHTFHSYLFKMVATFYSYFSITLVCVHDEMCSAGTSVFI